MGKRLTADGPKLRKLRRDAWLNQDELAEMAGVSEHTVMRIELGRTPHPSRTTVRKIARALGVHPGELVVPEDDADPLAHARRFGRPRMAVGVG